MRSGKEGGREGWARGGAVGVASAGRHAVLGKRFLLLSFAHATLLSTKNAQNGCREPAQLVSPL